MEINSELFTCALLDKSDLEDLAGFVIRRKEGKGLERYLKEYAYEDQIDGTQRTYIVRDKYNSALVGYFTLKAISMAAAEDGHVLFPGVEISNFGVNDAYREMHSDMHHIGKIIFIRFILPYIHEVAKIIGVKCICIFALPYKSLIDYYKSMGFKRLDKKTEQYMHNNLKPQYDEYCIFMYQNL